MALLLYRDSGLAIFSGRAAPGLAEEILMCIPTSCRRALAEVLDPISCETMKSPNMMIFTLCMDVYAARHTPLLWI